MKRFALLLSMLLFLAPLALADGSGSIASSYTWKLGEREVFSIGTQVCSFRVKPDANDASWSSGILIAYCNDTRQDNTLSRISSDLSSFFYPITYDYTVHTLMSGDISGESTLETQVVVRMRKDEYGDDYNIELAFNQTQDSQPPFTYVGKKTYAVDYSSGLTYVHEDDIVPLTGGCKLHVMQVEDSAVHVEERCPSADGSFASTPYLLDRGTNYTIGVATARNPYQTTVSFIKTGSDNDASIHETVAALMIQEELQSLAGNTGSQQSSVTAQPEVTAQSSPVVGIPSPTPVAASEQKSDPISSFINGIVGFFKKLFGG